MYFFIFFHVQVNLAVPSLLCPVWRNNGRLLWLILGPYVYRYVQCLLWQWAPQGPPFPSQQEKQKLIYNQGAAVVSALACWSEGPRFSFPNKWMNEWMNKWSIFRWISTEVNTPSGNGYPRFPWVNKGSELRCWPLYLTKLWPRNAKALTLHTLAACKCHRMSFFN